MGEHYKPMDNDHLGDMIREAIARFAVEDSCTEREWMSRAVRMVAVKRLRLEAAYDRRGWLSAQRFTDHVITWDPQGEPLLDGLPMRPLDSLEGGEQRG